MTTVGFREKLETNQTLVTVELSPPKGVNIGAVISRVNELKGRVDGINIPDCQRSVLKMSSMAASKLIQDETGVEAVWQLTCRDRNLIALQADLMGAYALGIQTVLALTGDPVQVGDQKDVAKQVFHLESVRLLELIQKMNRGVDATGKELKQGGTDFIVGAALNAARISNHAQLNRLKQKLERGVQFFQTQPVYSIEPILHLNETLEAACRDVGCPVPRVLIGIIPPKSAESARFMNRSVPGIHIPEEFITRLDTAKDPAEESIQFCADLVQQLKAHANGFHFMPVAMASKMSRLLDLCFALA